MSLQRFLHEWAIPAVIGLGVAAALLLMFPHLRGKPEQAPVVADFQGPVSYASAVNLAGPAVVNIYSRRLPRQHPLANHPLFRHLFENMTQLQRERMNSNLGSGVIVDRAGYILTNYHVIFGADEIAVVLSDGREARAAVVGSADKFDLAVLKINLPNLTAIEAGDSDKAQVGDVVLAIGNPWGVGQSVTQGIISATGRDLSKNGAATFFLQNFIQTDAAINPGNSGGALVDARGKLVGINTEILKQSSPAIGISFAIPANIALKIMQDIIEFGRVVPGWLGIGADPLLPEVARSYKLPSTNGVIITFVNKSGPAYQAGLKPGDVITHINDIPINDGEHGLAAMATLRPGEVITITYIRNGEVRYTRATVAEDPQSQNRN
ncbi:S1C family serine protease [Microbulbifer pacificus]|uniref:Trypsin-like peptidase domain-containing protein n=1 Tax=Microbulbifer pacificus TaxID=407164 RepID=A0AAU0N1W1_9GAMM|nr:trypsin-like peptidase domain-containing protein [Microbulbifer pacificus]WOX06467.1 trypsin-like peptidase domain-containing protein [Microbulbifer pacificus]